MSDILVVGTVAIDSVETPKGKLDRGFGGSASYFAYAASFFSKSKIKAVVGHDFPNDYLEVLKTRDIDTSGIHQHEEEKTFFWSGKYEGSMNSAITLETQLNALMSFDPEFEDHDVHPILFLANIDPTIQLKAIKQKPNTEFIMVDTMNFWIENKKEELLKVFQEVDAIIVNEGEAEMLTGCHNLIQAGHQLQRMGPKIIILKKGEHGVLLFHGDNFFSLPAYPVKDVFDPTGAGDSFAGGLVGYLAKEGKYDFASFKKALAYATVVASFTVESFSLERLKEINESQLHSRFSEYVSFISIDG